MARHGKAWNAGSEPSCPAFKLAPVSRVSGHDCLTTVEW